MIPGYAEAVQTEQDRRDRAWVAAGTVLFDAKGKPVLQLRPLTYRHYLTLLAAENWFVAGGKDGPHLADLLAIAWLLSPDYRPGWGLFAFARRRRCWGRLVRLPVQSTVDAIQRHVTEALADVPSTGKKQGPVKAPRSSHFAAVYCTLRHALGMGLAEVLDMPMGQLNQLLREVLIRADRTITFDDQSERIKRQWLIDQTAMLRARHQQPETVTHG
jgi:hypothetical protein